MFGVEKQLKTLVTELKAKVAAIGASYPPPAAIPPHDLGRMMALNDVAEIINKLLTADASPRAGGR